MPLAISLADIPRSSKGFFELSLSADGDPAESAPAESESGRHRPATSPGFGGIPSQKQRALRPAGARLSREGAEESEAVSARRTKRRN